MKIKNTFVISGTIAILYAGTLSAGEESVTLDPISVEATRTEKPLTAIPNTVTIIDGHDIDVQTAINDDLQSILEKTVPGFGPSMNKLVGRGESFRGRNPLYLIDGIPQHNPLRDGQRDGRTIDTDFLERIEVIHGSNSIQGIGATGGVVSLVTKSADDTGAWTNEAKVALTTHDSFDSDGFHYKLSFLSGKKFDQFDVMGGVAFHKRDLFFDADGDPVGLYATQGDIMDSLSKDFFLKLGFEPDDNQRIQLMVNDFNLESDGDYIPVKGNRSTGLLSSTERGDPRPTRGDPVENDVTSISLDYTHEDLFSGKLRTQVFYQDFEALYQGGTFNGFFRLTPDGPDFLDQSQIESKKLGAKFTYYIPDFGVVGFQPTIGLDILRDESKQVLVQSSREWVPEVELVSYAPFFQIDHTLFEKLHLTAGLRREIVDLNVDDFITIAASESRSVSGGKPSFEKTLPNIGLSFDVGSGVKVYASYAEGFTMPDVGRVLRGIKTVGEDVDNFLDLEPVITENKEIGLDYIFERGSFHLSYYWSDAELGSRLEKNSADFFTVKREKTAIEGLELSAEFDLTGSLVVGMNYAWLKGEFDSDKDDHVDSDLDGANIAPNRLNAYLDAEFDNGLFARVQVSHLFDRDFRGLKAPTDADFDGFTTADIYIAKEIGKGKLSFAVENILDKHYVTYFSQTESRQKNDTYFGGNGRTLTLIYNHKF